MALTIRQVKNVNDAFVFTNNYTTQALTSAPLEGNSLFFIFTFYGDSGTLTRPSGWSSLGQSTISGGTTNVGVHHKKAGVSEASQWNWQTTDEIQHARYTIIEFDDSDETTWVDVAGTYDSESFGSSEYTISAITTITNGAIDVPVLHCSDGTPFALTNGSGYTEQSADIKSVAAYTKAIATAGSTGTRGITNTGSEDRRGISFAVRPASGGGATPTRGEVSFAEFETPNVITRGRVSFAELETTNVPTRGRVSFTEFETSNVVTRGNVSFAEFQTDNVPTRGRVSFAEIEIGTIETRGLVSFAELEVPSLLTRGLVSFAELEVPQALTRGRASFAELETPNTPTRGLVSQAFLEISDAVPGSMLFPMGDDMRSWQGGNIPVGSLKSGSKLDASANAAAAITITGVSGRRHVVDKVFWSYKGGTPDGKLTIASTGVATLEFDIVAAGPGSMDVDFVGGSGQDVVITLAAGGVGITGKVNEQHTTELG